MKKGRIWTYPGWQGEEHINDSQKELLKFLSGKVTNRIANAIWGSQINDVDALRKAVRCGVILKMRNLGKKSHNELCEVLGETASRCGMYCPHCGEKIR